MRINWFSYIRVTGLLLVLIYHFFPSILPGGFIGVDVFFTFSGYLITALLIDEVSRTHRIDYLGFMRRRFYRIVPPLVLMVLICTPLALLVRNDFIAGIGRQITSVIGFVTNYYEILTGGNYENQFNQHIYLHTWSLAIEVHYYILWGALLWFLAKRVKHQNKFRSLVFMVSLACFMVSFLSMFISAFFVDSFSCLYFSSITHAYPFFLGSLFATLSGVYETTARFKKNIRLWTLKKTVLYMVGSFALLVLLGLVLHFEERITYLFGFVLASLFTAVMIYSARVLHEKLPGKTEPALISYLAEISYSVYLFHWPLYIIFSQLTNNIIAVILTTILSIVFATLSYYIIEPFIAGRKASLFGIDLDLTPYRHIVLYVFSGLTLITVLISLFAPAVGNFEKDLEANGLSQAQTKMKLTRTNAENSQATSFGVNKGVTVLGDSVALRSKDQLESSIDNVAIDAVVSRNLSTINDLLKDYADSNALAKDVVIAGGVNEIDDYKGVINKIIKNLPKGHHIIFVTPYNGSKSGNEAQSLLQLRKYELEMAEKYDFVTVADWYQVAKENISIWNGTDGVHFGSDSDSINRGAKLYTKTIKEAIEKADKAPVKGGKK